MVTKLMDACGAVDADTLKAAKALAKEVELPARQEMQFARFLAVGNSPAEAVGVVKSVENAKFDESVDMAVPLWVNP